MTVSDVEALAQFMSALTDASMRTGVTIRLGTGVPVYVGDDPAPVKLAFVEDTTSDTYGEYEIVQGSR